MSSVTPPASSPRSRSSAIAAFLSFLWPGLGQWYAGRTRAAIVFAVPVAIVLIWLLLWLAGGFERALLDMLLPSVALAFALVVVADAVWRIASSAHAAWAAGGSGAIRRPATGVTLAIVTIVVIVTHLWATAVAWSLYQASGRIFDPPVAEVPGASPDASGGFFATPGATPPTPQSRINVLLTGIDASERRSHALTDTLIVVSVDPVTGDVSMVSFPRDISDFAEPDGTPYPNKINSLMTYAANHPEEYPKGGLPTLMDDLGFLLGVPIHYYAAVDLAGFSRLVDSVGGVTINNPKLINDPAYGGWTDGRPVGFRLEAGVHTLDGETALAYARSRKGTGDNDFTRARRQQQLLLAIRARLTDAALLPQLPAIVAAGAEVVQTNFPRDRVADMLAIGRAIEGEDSIRRVVLGPPYATNPPAGTPGGYQLRLDMDRLTRLSLELYGEDSAYAAATR